MEIYILILLIIAVGLLVMLFLKAFNGEKVDENKILLSIIKNINEENEKNRNSLNNSISEFRKEFNESFNVLLEQESKASESSKNILNEQFEKIRGNLENKLTSEFDKVNKAFNLNNEALNKIRENFIESEKSMTKTINENLSQINKKVEERLSEGFKETNKTFQSIIERLTRIDAAQKNIENLSQEVVSLQDILSDKKARGSFGEVQLSMILSSAFGENNKSIFELQKVLSNNSKPDAFLHMNSEQGSVAIDSKFPLENFKIMRDKESTDAQVNEATKAFKRDIKKHIDDISFKYIIDKETAPYALMFVPSEVVFAEINAYYDDLISYATKKGVYITSPTTLMAFLKVIIIVNRDNDRIKNARIIVDELEKLAKDFSLYKDRWSSLQKNIDRVGEDVKKINITTDKITNTFEKISNVKIEDKEN